MGGDRRAAAAQEVADRGQLSIRVAIHQGFGALDEAPEDLGVALCNQVSWLDDDASTIGRVGASSGVASLLEAVDDGGDATGGEAEGVGQLRGREGSGAAEDVQAAHVGAIETVDLGGEGIEAVDLGAEGAQLSLDSLNERTLSR